jgi:NAD(P)-dependent dehydrogenase (short-subunit alcohol dehydrogenase family)
MPDQRLVGTKILITGAATGLGQAMALGLLRQGAELVATDISDERLADLRGKTAEFGEQAHILVADLSKPDNVEKLAERATDILGQVDVLINNAGIGSGIIRPDFFKNPVRFWEHTPELTTRYFQVNSIAPYRLAILLVRGMVERGWGRIINVTTSLDTMLRPGMAGYGGSKAGLEAHSAVMAGDLDGTGVTVNVLVPGGPADTPMVPTDIGDRSKLISPQMMVAPAIWLSSRESDAVSGRRFASVHWDPSLPDSIASEQAGAPVAWKGYGTQAVYPMAEEEAV